MPATMQHEEPETLVMTVYPSIAADGPGKLIGWLMNCFPVPGMKNVKLSAILFAPIFAPFALLGYFGLKLFGQKYVLTNRAIRSWKSIGVQLVGEVPLSQISDIEIRQTDGQKFFHAADLDIKDKGGNTVLTLAGVPRADVFRQIILKAHAAHTQVEAALATIAARTA